MITNRASMQRLPTAAQARMWLRIFMALYRRGVLAAMETDDDGLCRQYLDITAGRNNWGELTDDYISPCELDWQIVLRDVARQPEVNRARMLDSYLRLMGRYGGNFLSAVLVLSLDWYRRGVCDALENPSASFNAVVFRDIDYPVFWTRTGAIKVGTTRIVDETFRMARLRMGAGEPGKIRAPKVRHYDHFRNALAWALRYRKNRGYGR